MILPYFKLSLFFIVFACSRGEDECGVALARKTERIVGGTQISYFKYPWYVALVLARNPKQLVCGGTLIGKKHVLTAGHCFKPFFRDVRKGNFKLEDLYLLKIGVDNICIKEERVQTHSVKKVSIPEKYYQDLLYYDLALIELNEETDFMPACLPQIKYDDNSRTKFGNGTILGLGKERSDAWKLPCYLKEATVKIQKDEACRHMLDSESEDSSKMHDAFCAGYLDGGVDTCQGDSGGPLLVTIKENKLMILGITSFGFGCANPNVLGVYTDVSHHLDWINENRKNQANTKEIEFRPSSVSRMEMILSKILDW